MQGHGGGWQGPGRKGRVEGMLQGQIRRGKKLCRGGQHDASQHGNYHLVLMLKHSGSFTHSLGARDTEIHTQT